MKNNTHEATTVSIPFAGKTLTLQTGELAPQATASVFARLGDTAVLVTVVCGKKTELDYFPLSVEYVERLYAGGKIKGSRWVKREGRPSDEAILSGRLIDRSIRPLFPKAFKHDVQVIVTVLSVDGENEPDILALNAVSAALAISNIPWNGPIGAIRMGYAKTEEAEETYLYNPTTTESKTSTLDIVVSQSKEKTIMIESGALQVPENIVLEAVVKSHEETRAIIAGIEDLVKKVGQEKLPVPEDTLLADATALVSKSYTKEVEALIAIRVAKEGGDDSAESLIARILEEHADKEFDAKTLTKAIEAVMFSIIRSNVVTKKQRADGRAMDEIRNISGKVGILPRTHGSALFNRGLTQALSVVTLGSPRLEQLIESAEGEESKRYMHHYSGPPYSFGQTGRAGFLSRREIGHGALAERALLAVIPTSEVFPYTIRVVSEVLSQNGSSSMASTCGSTLALMDAGVPITALVAGISIGMYSTDKEYQLITDIIGLEDFSGDMDFKVAGTETGITAIQLDVKNDGLTDPQVEEILARARAARMLILETIQSILPQSRTALSEYAPKIEQLTIPVDKIGEVIGPGGKNIKAIIAQTGADVDIDDSGLVSISAVSEESVKKAVEWISGMTREVVPGEVFEGTVKRMLPFGAFVEYLPGKEGLVHVSKMRRGFVQDPSEVVAIGDTVTVKVEEKDSQGRINLTMLLEDEGSENDQPRQPREPREQGQGYAPSNRSGGFSKRPYDRERRFDRNNQNFDRNQSGGRSEHPLAKQFRRENQENQRNKPRFYGERKRFGRS